MRRDGYQPDHGTLDPKDPPGGRSAVQPIVRCPSGVCETERGLLRVEVQRLAALLVEKERQLRLIGYYGDEERRSEIDRLASLSNADALLRENAWLRGRVVECPECGELYHAGGKR